MSALNLLKELTQSIPVREYTTVVIVDKNGNTTEPMGYELSDGEFNIFLPPSKQLASTQKKPMNIEEISKLVECAEGRLLGHIEIAVASFHCEFFRVGYKDPKTEEIVTEEVGGEQFCDSKDEDTVELWEDRTNAIEGAFETVKIPGREGDWVLFISPFMQ